MKINIVVFRRFFILFTMLCAVLSCEYSEPHKDALVESETMGSRRIVRQVKTLFEAQRLKQDSNIFKGNLTVDWQSLSMQTKDSTTYYVFEAQTVEKWQVESSILQDDIFNVIAFVNNNNEIEVSLLKIKPHKESPVQDYSFFNLESFGGMLYFYNLEGELPLIAYWEDGQMVESIENELIPKNKLHFSTAKCAQKVVRDLKLTSKCNSLDPDCDSNPLDPCRGGGGGYVPVVTYYYTDWYKIYSNGDSEYTYTQYNGSTTEYVYVSNPDGGNYSQSAYSYYNYYASGSGGYYTNTAPEAVAPKRVILDTTFQNNDKANCTFEQLLENSQLKRLLNDFFGEDAAYDLYFEVVPNLTCGNSGDPEGCTSNNLKSEGAVTIKIDQDYINDVQTPTLFIAQTIIHEAIHANMYLAIYNHVNGNLANIPDVDDFPAIYEEYRVLNNWQHEFMADHYIGLIAQGLQEVHLRLNDQIFIDDLVNSYPDLTLEAFYTNLAWIGLNGTQSQTTYLSNPDNLANYSICYEAAKSNSTKTPNCN
ncbi:hypothetical protein [Snuella sedimenti]|uniref:Uncharacterized protein n=1 Tax=Snuella sedimenti TaxID=2798802 RepID=A0A8J7J3H3_9FLAO|nr:hypothetical protein [Snuella sedimenti]MBJ6369097.1 hypothetical protein [Snuella sedimenti]